jgi:GT2 family glycosyltransferase
VNELAILIVSYNTADDLQRCLDSLLKAPPVVSHQIVVIDNASRDGSVEGVRSLGGSVRLISLPSNAGFAAANNVGFRNTQSQLVLLLNSDTIVPAGAIDRLVQEMRNLPGASVVGPRLINAAGAAELSFGRMMGPFAELRQKLLNRAAAQARVEAITSRAQETDWVSGACLLVRRTAAESAGLLDERYFMYCEDVDFCAAIRKQGGRVYFTPSVQIIHLRGRSGDAHRSATDAAYRKSHLAFYQKHHPAWAGVLWLYLAALGKLPPESADNP